MKRRTFYQIKDGIAEQVEGAKNCHYGISASSAEEALKIWELYVKGDIDYSLWQMEGKGVFILSLPRGRRV